MSDVVLSIWKSPWFAVSIAVTVVPYLAYFGGIVGWRLAEKPKSKSSSSLNWLAAPSTCEGCRALLPWYSRAPLFGFAFGCRKCGKRGAWIWPLVEWGTLTTACVVAWNWGPLALMLCMPLIFFGTIIFASDFRNDVAPNVFSGILLGWGAAFSPVDERVSRLAGTAALAAIGAVILLVCCWKEEESAKKFGEHLKNRLESGNLVLLAALGGWFGLKIGIPLAFLAFIFAGGASLYLSKPWWKTNFSPWLVLMFGLGLTASALGIAEAPRGLRFRFMDYPG